MFNQSTLASTQTATVHHPSRTIDSSATAISSALRRVVHDYVSGWSIVLTQTPRERRRKKRIWNRRSSQRHAFRRPVWVRRARWAPESTRQSRCVLIDTHEDMQLVRDISANGIGLTSDKPPRAKLVVLHFDSWRGAPIEVLVALHWRQRVAMCGYRCGGSVIGVLHRDPIATRPAEQAQDDEFAA